MSFLTTIDRKIGSLFHNERLDRIERKIEDEGNTILELQKEVAILKKSTESIHFMVERLQPSTPLPEKNTIDKEEIKEIDLDEDVHVPLVSGMNIQIEGEKQSGVFNPL